MKLNLVLTTLVLCLAGSADRAVAQKSELQKWEVGVAGGGSMYRDKTVTNGTGTASAGFEQGFAISGLLGNNMYNHAGGELRYTFEKNDMRLSNGTAKATFASRAQSIHYDFLIYFAERRAKVRPFVAIGGGVKFYEGIGDEVVFQPLSNFALLTKTRDMQGLLSFGGGVKFAVSKHVNFRVEFRDYMTRFPKKIIAASGNSKVDGWMHNIMPMVGLTFLF